MIVPIWIERFGDQQVLVCVLEDDTLTVFSNVTLPSHVCPDMN